jgi:hypothetical protein
MAQDKQAGKPAVQIELRTPAKEAEYARVLVTWVSTELKPKVGMVIVNPPDKTEWTVTKTYSMVNHFEGLPSWRTK